MSKLKRKGLERWPLIRAYEYIGKIEKACGESLRQLTEIIDSVTAKNFNVKIKESLAESFQLCKKVKKPPSVFKETVKSLLSTDKIARNYQSSEGEWENNLFQFLDMKIFYPILRETILTFHIKWKGKDLLPLLLLSHIQDYKKEEIKKFFNLFSPKPVSGDYLNLLIAEDFFTVEELEVFLPLSKVNSYHEAIPWFQKMGF